MSNEFNRCTFNFQKIALTSAIICMSIFQEEGQLWNIVFFVPWDIENWRPSMDHWKQKLSYYCHARLQIAGLWLCVESPWLAVVLVDRVRLAGLGLMEGFFGTGGLHLGSLPRKKSQNHIFVFNANERFQWKDKPSGFFHQSFFSLPFKIFYFLWIAKK